MDEVAGLGKEKQRLLTGTDVTDQYTDLEARLKSNIALRDRLQQLLARAATLDEVLGLEKQIARLQADIDGLQARIDQLKSHPARLAHRQLGAQARARPRGGSGSGDREARVEAVRDSLGGPHLTHTDLAHLFALSVEADALSHTTSRHPP